jgi:hypothetical protein
VTTRPSPRAVTSSPSGEACAEHHGAAIIAVRKRNLHRGKIGASTCPAAVGRSFRKRIHQRDGFPMRGGVPLEVRCSTAAYAVELFGSSKTSEMLMCPALNSFGGLIGGSPMFSRRSLTEKTYCANSDLTCTSGNRSRSSWMIR